MLSTSLLTVFGKRYGIQACTTARMAAAASCAAYPCALAQCVQYPWLISVRWLICKVSRPVFRGVVYSGVSWARCGGHHSSGRDCLTLLVVRFCCVLWPIRYSGHDYCINFQCCVPCALFSLLRSLSVAHSTSLHSSSEVSARCRR